MKIKIFATFFFLIFSLFVATNAYSYDQYYPQTYSQQTYNQTYNQDYAQEDYADYEGGVEIGYPAIDTLERKVLGGAYAQEDVYQRLDRLEMKIFGQVSSEPLCDRVDRLESALGMSTEPEARPSYRSRNVVFGQGNRRYGHYYDYENSYNDYRNDEFYSYDSDDPYDSYEYDDRQARYGQYQDYSTEANVLSLIFMILQAFL